MHNINNVFSCLLLGMSVHAVQGKIRAFTHYQLTLPLILESERLRREHIFYKVKINPGGTYSQEP
jgi:hypothetical protein